ncbi:LysR family transcriptional regulator [Alcaligenaceae bacterium]|nr:LysR family transcriptional regulator [Alcaligenaceae bacterium]
MHITLRQLRYFVEIAQCQSFSRAAQRLLIAQPALSQNISALEKELGAVLLERHARGVRLTPAGERLLAGAKDMLAKADSLGEMVVGHAQAPSGLVRLSVAGSLASLIVGPLLREVATRYPGVELTIQEGLSFEVRTHVESGRAHLAVMPSPSEIPGIASLPVYEERFMLFGSPAIMRRKPRTMPFEKVADLPLAVPDGAHDLRKIVERAASAMNRRLDIRYELNSAQMLIAIASEGLAYAIMPPTACMDAIAARTIVGRPIAGPELSRVQAVVWSRHRQPSPAAEAVGQSVQNVIAALIGAGKLPGRPFSDQP